MKKLAYSLIAMAIAAFTFTSCEDVPSPFGEIVKPETGGGSAVIEPTGDGTEASPYNVAAVIEYVSGLGADVTSDKEVYIKGIVTEVTEKFGTQYGNATFVISDVESGGNKFTFYRGLYLGNTKYSKDTDTNIKDGDVVVICGKVVNYKGNTPETSQGNAYVVSINGQGGGTTPTPGGEDEIKTVTIADFNAAAESTSVWYQLTGTVKGLKDNDKYGNFDLEDATGSVYVYGLLAEKGGEKQKFQELAAAKGIKNGCKLTIIGNRGSFGDKIEVVNAYVVSVEAGSEPDTPTPSGTGDGTEANPYSVSAAIAKAEQAGVFVKAYIVGWVEGQVYTSGAHFDGTSSSATNILIAESASETDPAKCMPVQLPNGNIRTGLNLMDNSGNYKKEVILYGDIAKYFGVPGLKNTSYAKIGTTEIGTKPGSSSGGGDTSSGYKPVATIANGNYVIGATDGGKVFVAMPLDASKTYGYLGKAETTPNGNAIETDAANEFKFTAVDGGYTIQSPDGRYLYMKGTYNSFNVDSNMPAEGHVWTITFDSNNIVSIKNNLTGKTIQYSTQYNSYGAYTDITNVLPVLYKK